MTNNHQEREAFEAISMQLAHDCTILELDYDRDLDEDGDDAGTYADENTELAYQIWLAARHPHPIEAGSEALEALRFLVEIKDKKERNYLYRHGPDYPRDKEKAWSHARALLATRQPATGPCRANRIDDCMFCPCGNVWVVDAVHRPECKILSAPSQPKQVFQPEPSDAEKDFHESRKLTDIREPLAPHDARVTRQPTSKRICTACSDAEGDCGQHGQPAPVGEYSHSYDNFKCGDCGCLPLPDAVIPSEIWNQIAPDADMLCIRCMDKRADALGLRDVIAEFFFVGKSIKSRLYISPPADDRVSRLVEAARKLELDWIHCCDEKPAITIGDECEGIFHAATHMNKDISDCFLRIKAFQDALAALDGGE